MQMAAAGLERLLFGGGVPGEADGSDVLSATVVEDIGMRKG